MDGATVEFDGIFSPSVTFINTNLLEAETPAHGAGYVDIRVTNPDWRSDLYISGYQYIEPPKITSVFPYFGSTTGGNIAVITGADFENGLIIKFNGVEPSSYAWVSSTRINCTM